MKACHYDQVESQAVEMPGAEGCRVRWLIGEPEGAPNFAMRMFEVAVGGHTPRHRHPYEHEVFVLEGEGVIEAAGQQKPLRGGDVVYVAPSEVHQFRNTGPAMMKFLCLVPAAAANLPVTQAEDTGAEPAC